MPEPRDYYQLLPPTRVESRGELIELIAHSLQSRLPTLMPATARLVAEEILRGFKHAGLRIARARGSVLPQ